MEKLPLTPLVDPFMSKVTSIRHGFYNRHGGVSEPPFDTNNCSYGVGDMENAVSLNREEIKSTLGISVLLSARQVHGEDVYATNGRILEIDEEVDGYDALITNQVGVGLLIQQADCQGVLIHDPVKKVIAAVHCGWRGSVVGIVGKTVAAMTNSFGTNPNDLVAAVSPSLGPCCAQFIHHEKELPESFCDFQVQSSYFDFWQITRWQLEEAGVRRDAVFTTDICTSCSTDYFSYRRARRRGDGITGRNCSVIALSGM